MYYLIYIMLSLSCDLQYNITVIHISSLVVSWDSKVSIECVLHNLVGSSKSSRYSTFCLLLYEYCVHKLFFFFCLLWKYVILDAAKVERVIESFS